MPSIPAGDHEAGELPDHVVEDLLADERRELMVATLAERSSPMVLDDLMRTVLAAERDVLSSEVSREERVAARTEAYEVHLPKLTAVGAVRYDSLVGTVELIDESLHRRVDRST